MDDSTFSDIPDQPAGPAARWATRLGIVALFGLVLAAAAGLLGLRTGTVDTTVGDYHLEVEHASLTRAGQPAPLHVRVTRAGGFPGPVQIALCDSWFDDVDFQSWYPTPSAETGDRGMLIYEFDPPPGNTLEVSLDARTAPGQFGERSRCEIAVLEEDAPIATVEFETWRLP